MSTSQIGSKINLVRGYYVDQGLYDIPYTEYLFKQVASQI